MSHVFQNTLKTFPVSKDKQGYFYSIPELGKTLGIDLSRLPVSIRIVLESVLRNCDGKKITEEHVRQLANWKPGEERTHEIPFVVARVILQDFTGIPLLVDLAAMRNVAVRTGKNPKKIEPLVPVDLVVDHSVQIDYFRRNDALDLNMKLEFSRNRERYQFMKWGMQAFDTFGVVPPGFGIVHQVNMEYLAPGVHKRDEAGTGNVYYPDTLVGTDSHTTMINGVGVVGWGVGGIEAEAGMLGQPVYFLTPDVIGMHLSGKLREGCTATDLVLTITERLRKEKVVGKFVEFFGEGAASLSATDRATIANMAPEYGATVGFFPVDDATIRYFRNTGRTDEEVSALESYFKAQGMFGIPKAGQIDYTRVVELDLGSVTASVAGPRRPQDRIELGNLKKRFTELFGLPVSDGGFNKKADELANTYRTRDGEELRNGDILIAAITSCTNTSNPAVLLAAGLLAKKAVEAGLEVSPRIKTSLAPGSRIVTGYLEKAGLLPYLEKLGFTVAAYGCTTCIGNAGDLTPAMNEAIIENDVVAAAVLSGNRNFEARIHPNIRANFLASPPLVVAYAIAGNVNRDLTTEPLGKGKDGKDIYLSDIWPTSHEVAELVPLALDAPTFRKNYSAIKSAPGELWQQISGFATGDVYDWPQSTYIAEPPFFNGFTMEAGPASAHITGARALALFGDSITTDHISPAGSIQEKSPAGQWLREHGIAKADFNSFGSRRGNHEVMMRGTFGNVRIKNLMLPAAPDGSRREGGYTLYQPDGAEMSIFDAAMRYQKENVPTIVIGGEEYGTGSSRDWAAKGTQLLGVKAVIARSFERIHRSNLVGMAVLPLQFTGNDSAASLGLRGDETFDLLGLDDIQPLQDATLVIHRTDGTTTEVPLLLRIDTPIEVDYFRHGGILPYVLRQLLAD
ncbi:aconitate hydratase AcnA [Oxalobacter sp. OxGP1]|uniref:aconitate hydratase AcnA n=1 Tax=Oxalobacter paeniformigenes TaxID=2946594 RepID=UPI0022B01BDE|nr:aconitate hydratase AcnA [Oxalobacter paeniformigenes]MCZ4053334.1 aconitate hydratase AcnA [Oxalobacter paeniformigenes]